MQIFPIFYCWDHISTPYIFVQFRCLLVNLAGLYASVTLVLVGQLFSGLAYTANLIIFSFYVSTVTFPKTIRIFYIMGMFFVVVWIQWNYLENIGNSWRVCTHSTPLKLMVVIDKWWSKENCYVWNSTIEVTKASERIWYYWETSI